MSRTYTIQPLTWTVTQKTEKTQAGEDTCDILSVCDSLNRLCETLGRLAYVVQAQNSSKIPIIYNKGRIL
jgi:hypothetical protein